MEASNANGALRLDPRILILTAGTFAIGTDAFVIAGILPELAHSLEVQLSDAGLLVTLFALAYALSAPVSGASFGHLERRSVLTVSLTVFAAANLLAALASTYAWLAVARMLAAASAAVYSPAAVACAVQLSPPSHRARASSMVYGGLTLSLVTGVPLGSLLARLGSWHTTFFFVLALSTAAVVAIRILLPKSTAGRAVSLRQRFAPLQRPAVLATLLSGYIWMTGGIFVYTYIARLVSAATGWGPAVISPILLLYGASALAGNYVSGRASDSVLGAQRTLLWVLALHAAALVGLGFAALLGPPLGRGLALLGIALFAAAGWGCTAPQAARLIALAPQSPMEMLSLSTMATYLGIATGAALGGQILDRAGVPALAFVGAAAQFVAFACVLLFDNTRRATHEAGVQGHIE
jgi:MFS transporter, DHA1 family, inner membrane transport protein